MIFSVFTEEIWKTSFLGTDVTLDVEYAKCSLKFGLDTM